MEQKRGFKTQENISILKNYIFRQRRCFKQQTKKADCVKSVDEFIWKPGSREALQYLSKKGYKIIIISTTRNIKRKMSKNLQEINKKIIKDLKSMIQKSMTFYCLHN